MRRVIPILLLVGGSAWAQEKIIPANEDPIAGAKHEFEGVKAARNQNEPAKSGLPGLEAPEFSITKPVPKATGRARTATEILAEKKSANWLVDAMTKKDEKGEKAEAVDPDAALLRELKLDPEVAARAATQKTTEDKPAEKLVTAKTGPEFNPLTRFMPGWMTPKDFSLLKPGLAGASADSAIARGESAMTGPTGDLGASAEKGGALEIMALSRPTSLPGVAPASNPYLSAFTPPPQGVVGSGTLTLAAPVAAGPASTFSRPAEPPPVKSRAPEFVKPATDEKYFKQLKRF